MTAGARAAISWIVDRPKVASLATTTKLKWTVCGHLFPTTRSTTWSRPMVALTSALQDRWVRTRAFYSVSFCHRRADGSMGRVPMPKSANRTSSQEIDAAGSHRQVSRGLGEDRKRLEARGRYLERRQVEGPPRLRADEVIERRGAALS